MAIDLAALRAKMAARKLEETGVDKFIEKVVAETNAVVEPKPIPTDPVVFGGITAPTLAPAPTQELGTTNTSTIDHLDFLTKIDQLEQALIHTHPHMPVLLMKIHKQIAADPELVTVLSEDQIGIIVSGLKVQTKTELTGTVLKQSVSRAKKTKLSVDML